MPCNTVCAPPSSVTYIICLRACLQRPITEYDYKQQRRRLEGVAWSMLCSASVPWLLRLFPQQGLGVIGNHLLPHVSSVALRVRLAVVDV